MGGVLTTLLAAAVLAAPFASQDQVPLTPLPEQRVAQEGTCHPRRTCKLIRSCDEAVWYLQNCSWGGRLDRDADGRPCESLC